MAIIPVQEINDKTITIGRYFDADYHFTGPNKIVIIDYNFNLPYFRIGYMYSFRLKAELDGLNCTFRYFITAGLKDTLPDGSYMQQVTITDKTIQNNSTMYIPKNTKALKNFPAGFCRFYMYWNENDASGYIEKGGMITFTIITQ